MISERSLENLKKRNIGRPKGSKAKRLIETETLRNMFHTSHGRRFANIIDAQYDLAVGVKMVRETKDGPEIYTIPPDRNAIKDIVEQIIGKPKEIKADPSANEIMLGELLRRALVKGSQQNDTTYLYPTTSALNRNFELRNFEK
jgi:hypothetical protein